MAKRWYRGTWDPRHDISTEQTEFATEHRVPFLTSPYPDRHYCIGIVVEDQIWHGVVPTDEEVALVAAYGQVYQDRWFPKPNAFRAEMEAYAPYDIDGGANWATYFIKRENGGWGYRRWSWSHPIFLPGPHDPVVTLQEVIDRSNRS